MPFVSGRELLNGSAIVTGADFKWVHLIVDQSSKLSGDVVIGSASEGDLIVPARRMKKSQQEHSCCAAGQVCNQLH